MEDFLLLFLFLKKKVFSIYAWDKVRHHYVVLHYAREIATECHMRRIMLYVVIPIIS
jgi:hypothetical protein